MNKLLTAFFIFFTPLCWAENKLTKTIVYDAIDDMPDISAGQVPYYRDIRNDSLAIDARIIEYRTLFARANSTFEGESGNYDVSIDIVTEEDGEPMYRFLINGRVAGVIRGTYIGKDSELDLKPQTHTWTNIALKTGDSISVESSSHTNGEIPEHGGTAWARGRWQQLKFSPVGEIEQTRSTFDRRKDILIAQFDLKPDADDVHAVAALGSMLKHSDMKRINIFAVAGTVGIQDGSYLDANSLFNIAFGQEGLNWIDAKANWDRSVQTVRDRARAVIAQGGRVWVQEAGQSNFTSDWVKALIELGVSEAVIKNNVIVVQHSDWNESKTSPEDLAFVKLKTNYQAIDDGNKPKRLYNNKDRRGPFTPMYVDNDNKYLKAATSKNNSNKHTRKLWQEAVRLIKESEFEADYSVIPEGGVDFSDIVENWWILQLGQQAASVHAFWERYVSDIELDKLNPPRGRLAIVIDGNSPDPDDIGATPVMLGILQQTDLSDRLVHLSHSCDLDPFRNKARWQIDAENEARRQEILHRLSGRGIELFGPFKNLRNYYNCRTDQQNATQDLVDAINTSSKKDPLWIIEAGEPDLIGYALQAADSNARKYVHVVSHHPANDNSGDYFTWQQILEFGVNEHQIGDQNVGLQSPKSSWAWIKEYNDPRLQFIEEMLDYAEQDGVVPFQANKYDCSDAGMIYWWVTGADKGGNKFSTPADIKDILLLNIDKK